VHKVVPFLLFFLSGFCSLVYEVVWSRMMVLVFGNTTQATSIILSSFMGGLALGGYLWGRYSRLWRRGPLTLSVCSR
jgi:spermidine synthase